VIILTIGVNWCRANTSFGRLFLIHVLFVDGYLGNFIAAISGCDIGIADVYVESALDRLYEDSDDIYY